MYGPLVNLQVFLLINLTLMAKKIIQLKSIFHTKCISLQDTVWQSDLRWFSLRTSAINQKFLVNLSTKIKIIDLLLCSHNKKTKIWFCLLLRPDFSFCVFLIFGNHIKNHATFLQILATAAKNCWNYPVRHESSIRSVNMILSCQGDFV